MSLHLPATRLGTEFVVPSPLGSGATRLETVERIRRLVSQVIIEIQLNTDIRFEVEREEGAARLSVGLR